MQRLYDFLRRHPTWVDGFWAVVLFGLACVSLPRLVAAPPTYHGSLPVGIAISAVLSVVVALRRRMPEKMLLVAVAMGVAQLVLDQQSMVADFAMLVIIYTVAADGARWASRVGLIGGLCAGTLAQLRWTNGQSSPLGDVAIAVFQTVPFALAWVLGDSLRTRRAYLAQLEERAARLEKEREAQAKVAVAAERARIARELHDVVAHNVSVMVVQADGAAYILDTAPDQAKKALETISSTGRQALAEMRRLLGVLRTGEHQEGGEYVPQPDVDQIEELGHRPAWLATIIEDGGNRHYVLPEYKAEEQTCFRKLPATALSFMGNDDEEQSTDDYPHRSGGPMDRPYREVAGFHALDIGTNYFGLWTEADNIRRYYEKYPQSLQALEQRLGYRLRPSWIWQRKRDGTMELILGIANDGVAGVPGILSIYAESLDGHVKLGGSLDAGQPLAGQVRQASIILPQGMDGQQIRLRPELEVKGVRRPVRWACHQPTNPDGSLTIRLKKGSDANWRKGV